MTERFSDQAWRDVAGLRRSILELPFNRELARGTLSGERFRFYMIQDALYLSDYARALAAAAAKAPDNDAIAHFAKAAETAVIVERALHAGVFERFGLDPAQAAAAEPSPTCLAYTSYLLRLAATSGFEELVGAILPCFWIYWDVGNHVAADSAPDNPYQAWIDTYADPEFGAATDQVIAIADAAAARSGPPTRAAMLTAFRRATQYEWMFWDSAYRLEGWPVGTAGTAG